MAGHPLDGFNVDPYSRQVLAPNVSITSARLKDGPVGQVAVGVEIVWETKHAYSTQEEALTKANQHAHKAYKNLFGGK